MTRSGCVLLFLAIIFFAAIFPASAQTKSATQKKSHKKQKYPIGGSYPSGAKLKVAKDLPQRLAKWKYVQMPFRQQGLSPKEVKLVNKLAEAARYLDYIY